MRFAAIADIHGNCAALQAVLDDIAALGIRDVVNLGDCFSGPLEADRTGDLLLLLDMNVAQTVRGNHDRYLLETPPAAMAPPTRTRAGRARLRPDGCEVSASTGKRDSRLRCVNWMWLPFG
jgi:predicted phosphodiesterase